MSWKITKSKIPKVKNIIFIEGLPGIGNVGKIAIDLIIDELNAKKIMSLFSFSLPNSVFVNEKNLVELPKIEIYHKNVNNKDFFFLSGDVQPTNEEASYELAETILKIVQEYDCKEIVTLGGIGLASIPKHPKVYCTGNSKNFIDEFKKFGAHTNIYGVVGPIIGISGLLLGLSKNVNQKAAALLAETYGHPIFIGLAGASEIVGILNKKYKFNVSVEELEKEIKELEKEIPRLQRGAQPITKKYLKYRDISYIG